MVLSTSNTNQPHLPQRITVTMKFNFNSIFYVRYKSEEISPGVKHSWSPNSTDLYFWYLFVELAVVTPVERRNFEWVVPAARKSKLGPFSFQNIHAMYIKAQKQRTEQKWAKTLKKRCFFWSAGQLTEFGAKWAGSFGFFFSKRAGSFGFEPKWASSFGFKPKWASSFGFKLSQLAGGAKKTAFSGGFLPFFRPVPCFWAGVLYIKCLFCKKNQSNRPCLATGVPFTKFRRV